MQKQTIRRLMALLVFSLFSMNLFAGPVKRDYTIEGTLQQVREGKVFLLKQYPTGQETDSAVLVNGNFRFTGILKDDIVSAMLMMRMPATAAQLAENPSRQ